MAFNGTGTFVRIYNWVTDKINSVPITASRMDAEMDGMATGLSNCITKDGQTTISANIPFNSKKITGLAVGSARTDSINVGQVQDGQFTYLGTTGGAADAYTLTPSPAITAYVAPMRFYAKIAATNATTTPYLQISAIGTPASDAVIKKLAADKSEVAVVAGDMVANGIYEFQRNSGNTAWILLNPENQISTAIVDSNLINNLAITTSVAASALTVSLKTKAGNDPSTSEPIQISFRSSTASSGTYTTRSVTAATSIVVSSGSTLGTISAVATDLYVYALDNAGTIELGISSTLFPDNSIRSSTAEGGAGAADSSGIIYSTTARTNVPVRLIGIVNITELTAGTWVSNATTITSNPVGYLASNYSNTIINTASNSASLEFSIPANFLSTEFEVINIVPANNGAALAMQFSTDNGSTWITTNYLTDGDITISDATNVEAQSSATRINLNIYEADASLCPSNTANRGGTSGLVRAFALGSSSIYKYGTLYMTTSRSASAGFCLSRGNWRYEGATTTINRVRFIFKTFNSDTNNGNIASGAIKMRGLV